MTIPNVPEGGRDGRLYGYQPILDHLATLGIPTTRRTLHRWMERLPSRRQPPVRRVVLGRRVTLEAEPDQLSRWVRRMEEDRYAGFTKIRAHQEKKNAS